MSDVEEGLVAANGISFSTATDSLSHGPESVVVDHGTLLSLRRVSGWGRHSARSDSGEGEEAAEMHSGDLR